MNNNFLNICLLTLMETVEQLLWSDYNLELLNNNFLNICLLTLMETVEQLLWSDYNLELLITVDNKLKTIGGMCVTSPVFIL
jgi:hypothetical protein